MTPDRDGQKELEEARKVYADNIVGYGMGREAPYAERLLFDVTQAGTEDIDETAIAESAFEQIGGKIKEMMGAR